MDPKKDISPIIKFCEIEYLVTYGKKNSIKLLNHIILFQKTRESNFNNIYYLYICQKLVFICINEIF